MSNEIDSSSSKSKKLTSIKVMNLKSQLKLYLELRNITAAELSRKSKGRLSKQVISQWLAGASPRKLEQVRIAAEILQTTVDQLCFGNGQDEQSQKVMELDALLGDGWISGLFEVRFRRVRRKQ